MADRRDPIIVEAAMPVHLSAVWKALTDQAEMIQWYFPQIPEFRAEVDFETQFTVVSDGRSFTHIWRVVRVDPGQAIAYTWRYLEYPGEGIVTFKLEEQGNSTIVTLINEGLNSFPEEIPEFSRESCIGGWNYFLKDRLASYLGKSAIA
jgi:uncharacterized protein YndB with AHSA1/START domain